MTSATGAPRVVLGVSGGISAYKAVLLLRLMKESGWRVRVVPTASALKMVGEPTWAALSGEPVSHEVWDAVDEVAHVKIGQEADLVVVAPATADLLSRAASGRADDLLTATLLSATCPVVMAPAMHTEMWLHPATQANVATLRSRGITVLDPAVGRLTGPDSGPGRLPEPAELFAAATAALAAPAHDLAGLQVVISAGGTREPLDPVRYLGNNSSGKQGYAIARAAVARGASVTVVSANVELSPVAGVRTVAVGTALELQEAVEKLAIDADVIVMAAAVADFRPLSQATGKIKKTDDGAAPTIELVRNPDILAGLGAHRREGQTLVGFAAETEDTLAHGLAKLRAKGCDLLVANRVGAGVVFGQDTTSAYILGADGSQSEATDVTKDQLAHRILDAVTHQRVGSHG